MSKCTSVGLAEPKTDIERRVDGSILLSNPTPLPDGARCTGEWLVDGVRKHGDRVLFGERDGDDWSTISWGEALQKIRAIASWLLTLKGGTKPVAILSDNSIDHALITLAGQYVGIPTVTISSAYSLISTDHQKLKGMIGLLDPQAIYVDDTSRFTPALTAIESLHTATIVASRCGGPVTATPFAEARCDADDCAVEHAFDAITPDTTAKYLFTSGSTGIPKAVINTHRMLVSNQEGRRINWIFLAGDPPVICDWLPWSHTFGGNHNFNMVLRNGGSLYIDNGRPVPALLPRTVANIKDITPNIIFNVPRGYDMLMPSLREDEAFRNAFFGTNLLCYAGAALPQNVWAELDSLSQQTASKPLLMLASWGSTETAPMAADCTFAAKRSGNIGVAGPGTTLKLVPNAGKYEVRVKGPNITPGYFKQPQLTKEAFDEEGFYVIGDAVRFADETDPAAGLYFDGRVTEDFKLATGIWVSVGELRVTGIEMLAPLAHDIVVAGHDRSEVGFLIFPNFEACRALALLGRDASNEEIIAHEEVRAQISAGLDRLKARGSGSSQHATRARLLLDIPDVDSGEITDKGYINQRQVLANRAADVEALFGEDEGKFVRMGV
ncbi:MAG: feruloyl-CoA synthase [Rhizobiaceae bacterium]